MTIACLQLCCRFVPRPVRYFPWCILITSFRALCLHVPTCICVSVLMTEPGRVCSYCDMFNQAAEVANRHIFEKNKTNICHSGFHCGGNTKPCLLDLSEVDLVLSCLDAWTWLQLEQRKTMEAFHWTLTTCTCSFKVRLFLYFCKCYDI